MKPFYGLRGTKLNIAIAFIAGVDFTLFGYDQGVMGGFLILPTFLSLFPQINVQDPPPGKTASYTSTIQGITLGSYTLGCWCGAVATIWLGNWLGRKRTMILGSSIMIIGATIQCSSFSLGQLIAARVLTGIGNGMNTSTGPVWQSETSKSHRRGQMVMIEGSMIICGVMLSYWMDLGFSFVNGDVSWRFPIAFQIVLALTIACLITGLPESPRWLVLKGRNDEALEVLCALYDLPDDNPKVQTEFKAIRDTVFEMAKGSFSDCFKRNKDRNLHRTVLAYLNQAMQQLSGINVITFYAATIFQNDIGLSAFMSRLLTGLNGTEYFMASWIAIFIIEKFGRRPLMLFGAAGQAASMAILAATTSQTGMATGIAAAVFLFVFNSFFAIGWLGMTWLVPAEITPLSIRAPANAISTTANWAFNFLVVMITPVAFANIGYKTYIIFAAINFFMIPTVYFFYPETSYRSLEEMDEIFHDVHGFWGIFDVVKVAAQKPRRFGKHGEILISYEETAEAREVAEHRRATFAEKVEEKAPDGRDDGVGVVYQEEV